MTTLRSLFLIIVALTLSAPSSRAVAWAISFRQFDGSNSPRQVEFVPVANSLVGFNSSKLVSNVVIGSGLSLSGGVLSATGGGGGGSGNVTASAALDADYLVLGKGSSALGTTPFAYYWGEQLYLTHPTFHVGINFLAQAPGMASFIDLGTTAGSWKLQAAGSGFSLYNGNGAGAMMQGFTGNITTAKMAFPLRTPSTSPTTGAVVVGDTSGGVGGLGVVGNINAGGTISGSNFAGSSTGTNTGDQNTFANIVVGATTITPGSTNGTLTLVPGSGMTITPSGTGNRTLTFASTGGGGGGGGFTTVTSSGQPTISSSGTSTLNIIGAGGLAVTTDATTGNIVLTAPSNSPALGTAMVTGGTVTANAIMIGDSGANIMNAPVTINRTNGDITTTGAVQAGTIAASTLDVVTLNLTNSVPVSKGGTGGNSTATAWVNLTIPSVTTGGSAIDWAAGPSHSRTLAANTSFTFSNAADGQTIIVAVTNTASNYTVTWPTVQWSGGASPTQTTGAKTDIYTFTKVGSTIYGAVSQNHF